MSALPDHAASALTLLEGEFPFADLSRVARADRYRRDAIYGAHKWWARRPPSVIRALLLAGFLPADTTSEAFWKHYTDDTELLEGRHVGDPFMGGATTLVEAARLGASVTGIDIDPLAVLIAGEELADADEPAEFDAAARELLEHLTRTCAGHYAVADEPVMPLHYFYLREVHCGTCDTPSLVYRTPVLARDLGKKGAVVRRRGSQVFCPDCLQVRHVPLKQAGFNCCGRRHRLDAGTYVRARHVCPGCGTRRRHDELRTGRLPLKLIAVEETRPGERRSFRAPTDLDAGLRDEAERSASELSGQVPTASLKDIDNGRPALYGFATVGELFHPRQQLVFASAFNWIAKQDLPSATNARLRLAISNALSSNNVLCGYATDYGRLAPLFMGVRSYAMPALSVELNPLHPSAGRGTIPATLRRVRASLRKETQRHVIAGTDIGEKTFTSRRKTKHHVRCQSADRAFPKALGACDAIVTDPPYFDFIAYSDLSLLYRAWLWPDQPDGSLGGRPIYPVGDDPANDFAVRLGRALRNAAAALRPNGTLAFTFHSANEEAWKALGAAVVRAELWVTAVFPVWTDARAAAHAHPGNCEWDVVYTCRRRSEASAPVVTATVESWIAQLAPDSPTGTDLINLTLGLNAALDVNRQEYTASEQRRAHSRADVQAG